MKRLKGSLSGSRAAERPGKPFEQGSAGKTAGRNASGGAGRTSEEERPGWSPGGILIRLIRFYQQGISPLKKPCCKYIPTCSNYALEAVRRFGALKGGALALWRILRCNPFSSGGYDPVPEKKKKGSNGSGGGGFEGPDTF